MDGGGRSTQEAKAEAGEHAELPAQGRSAVGEEGLAGNRHDRGPGFGR